MTNPASESKKLAIQLRANEDCYITGQLDLNETLDETERLWREVKKDDDHPMTVNEIMPDSDLMKLQTRFAKRSAKFYKPDSLVFNSTEFSVKLKQYYDNSSTTSPSSSQSSSHSDLLWLQIGNVAKKLFVTVPSFNFIHGTFDPDPIEVVKKKRKMKEKDKIGDLTRPESLRLSESSDNQDMMIKEAERVLGILVKLCRKNEDNLVCFYEFITDPTSFARTIENTFILSLLVKEGCARIVNDRKGLPFLCPVDENERKERNPTATKQSIFTITLEGWQNIVKTFKFKKPLIPPRKSILRR